MGTPSLRSIEYRLFVATIENRIHTAQLAAARSVNRELVLLYLDIGKEIIEKQRALGWGKAVVEHLSKDLRKTFPHTHGFSTRNLWDMRRLHEAIQDPAFLRQAVAEFELKPSIRSFVTSKHESILRQAVAELPWGQHLLLLNKVQNPAARYFYMRESIRRGWSRNVLGIQIQTDAYSRGFSGEKTHNFKSALPERFASQVHETLKSSYSLEFLGISREAKEREIETHLIERLKDFILELGYGFCFIGSQHRLSLGAKDYRVDLLFYHRFLKALVAIELKAGEFEPEYAGKLDFYLNLLNDQERGPDDNPSIGIILCREKLDLEVEYALKSKHNPIGVAEYQLHGQLPIKLKGKLPTAKQLSLVLKQV